MAAYDLQYAAIVPSVQGPQMRPLGFGEIFDVAIKIFWRNAWTLLAVVAVVVVPMQLASNLIILSTFPEPELLGGSVFQPATPTDPGFVDGQDVALMVAGVAVAGLLSFIATALATGASFKAVGDAYLGERPSWKASLGFGARRIHSLLWINFLTALTIGAIFFVAVLVGGFLGAISGEVAFVVILILLAVLGGTAAAAWIWVSWSVSTPALLTEDARGTKALGRSFRLIRGNWWRTFGLLILAYLIVFVISGIIQTVPSMVLLTDVGDSLVASIIINVISSSLASIMTTPFLAALVTVVYFDLRVRKEGFDLQLLAQRIGVPPPDTLPEALRPPVPVGWPQPPQGGWGHPAYGQPGWGPPPPAGSWPPPPPQGWPDQGSLPPGGAWPAPPPTPPQQQPPPSDAGETPAEGGSPEGANEDRPPDDDTR